MGFQIMDVRMHDHHTQSSCLMDGWRRCASLLACGLRLRVMGCVKRTAPFAVLVLVQRPNRRTTG